MPAYAYRDYMNHLFDESARTQQIAQQVLGNCEGLLNMFSVFIKGRFTETSNLIPSWTVTLNSSTIHRKKQIL
jgi:hypothetical protein